MMLSSTATPTTRSVRSSGRAPATYRHKLHVTCFVEKKSQQQTAPTTPASRVKGVNPSPTTPPVLIKEEEESLTAALKAAGLPENASAADLSRDAFQGVVGTIRKGLDKQEQDLGKLEGAMLLAEQLFHACGGNMAAAVGVVGSDPQAVDMWQPIFASAGGFPRLLYIPVPEYFDMHKALPDATAISISSVSGTIDTSSSLERAAAAAGASGNINIITELGPITTHFLGSCGWLNDTTFEYKINTIRLDVGGRSVSFGMGPFKLENQLSFFLTTPEVACARSKLGGTMLLAPEPAQGGKYTTSW